MTGLPALGPSPDGVTSHRYYPAPTDNVLVLAARGAGCEALARHVSGFGLASVYTVYAAGEPTVAAIAPFVEALRHATPELPVQVAVRPEAGPLALCFTGGRYGPTATPAVTSSWQAPDGARLAVARYPAAANVLVVLLHGASSHGGAYDPLARFIAVNGLAEVVVPTLRGHHGAGGRPGDVPHADQLVDDLAALLVELRAERPGTRVVLVGHSSGGGLALRFVASAHAALVDGAILLAPYLGPWAPTRRASTGDTWARPMVGRALALALAGPPGERLFGHLPVLAFEPPAEVRDGRETLRYSYRMVRALTPRFPRDVAAIARPALVLVGEADEVFRADRYAAAFARSRGAVVEVVPGATHLGVAFHPRAHAAIADWLRRFADEGRQARLASARS